MVSAHSWLRYSGKRI